MPADQYAADPAGSDRPGPYGFLGPEGSFAHAAAQNLVAELPGGPARLIACASVAEAVDAVRAGAVAGAVVPLENSVEGSVAATLDELAELSPLVIAAESYLPVVFDLLARPGTRPADIGTVATHPHAAAQVRRYLLTELPAARLIPVDSTAAGARAVADGGYDAAVAPAAAGRRYRLASLATDIADRPGAVTRFVLVRRPVAPPPPTGADRTTLVAYPRSDRAGALLEILAEFAGRGVNLTRIESRPTKDQLGRYCFSIDCAGSVADARVGDALAALHRLCAEVRYLGSYPQGSLPGRDRRPEAVPAGRTDAEFAEAAGWLARVRTTGTGAADA
ncbi:MAG: prephenate dehydratase [Actinobacteria bacterium]|nr:prephenate dehydratase [Actinomycetota bacterium]